MKNWAVITTGGKQYIVEVGKTIVVDKLTLTKDSTISFDHVLALGGDKVALGTPFVNKAKVQGKVIETFKDDKIRVVKFKSKSRYMRTRGHRQQKTMVLIEKISYLTTISK